MSVNDKKIIAVVGPTASGKTDLAIYLAKLLNGEIISADSMQIYKGMDISTAKPTPLERQTAVHHLVDFLDPKEKFDVTEFVALAVQKADDIYEREKLPILCGGTGLYIDSFLNGIQFGFCPDDTEIRKELEKRYDCDSQAVFDELKKIDELSAEKLHLNDKTRIVRALSVYYLTGQTISEQQRLSREKGSIYSPFYVGITYSDRQKLYDRIDLRVDKMLEAGLIDEARQYYTADPTLTSAQAIGIKELKPFFDGEKSLDECIEHLKFVTHHYAKRQLTWFRKNEKINWVYPDSDENYRENALDMCKKFLKKQ